MKHTSYSSLPNSFGESDVEYYVSFVFPSIVLQLRSQKDTKISLSLSDPYLFLHEDFQVVLGLWYDQLSSDVQFSHPREAQTNYPLAGSDKSMEYHVGVVNESNV